MRVSREPGKWIMRRDSHLGTEKRESEEERSRSDAEKSRNVACYYRKKRGYVEDKNEGGMEAD